MRRPVSLWILALAITLAAALYQRTTGPSYPAGGKVKLGRSEVSFQLPRTHGDGDAAVRVAADAAAQGQVAWKRFQTKDAWAYVPMAREGGELVARLPHQPPAGKLIYRVILQQEMERVTLGGSPVVIRFKGEVPMAVLVVHVICMFGGMLFSTRAALEYFRLEPKYSRLILVTVILLSVGGMALGPVVQKYAFDAYWTGWPVGTDLTDNKTAVAWLAWVIAWMKTRRDAGAGAWVVGAGVVTLVVFGIPHSTFGSELKYE